MMRFVAFLLLTVVATEALDKPQEKMVDNASLISMLKAKIAQLKKRVEAQGEAIARIKQENQKQKLEKLNLLGKPLHTGELIAFHVVKRNDQVTGAESEIVVFEEVKLNQGGGWNSTTSQFVVPRSGHYVFFLSIYSRAGGPSSVWVRRNEDDIQLAEAIGGSNNAGSAVIMYLDQNDLVDCLLIEASFIWGNTRSHFSGFLLHPTSNSTLT